MANMSSPVLGVQAAEREQIILDRLKEYADNMESSIFHVGDAKRLCPEFYEDQVEIAFDDLKTAQLFEVAPGYSMTSPRYYQFVEHSEYPKKCNAAWEITIRYREFGIDDPERVRFHRLVECDGKDYSLDVLGMFKLGTLILKAYIRTARATKAFPGMKFYWSHLLEKKEYFYKHDEGYYTQERGDFEVRLEEVNPA